MQKVVDGLFRQNSKWLFCNHLQLLNKLATTEATVSFVRSRVSSMLMHQILLIVDVTVDS